MFSEVGGVVVRKVWRSSGRCGGQDGRCGGQVVSVPATRSALPGFESQARASAQSGLLKGGMDHSVNTVQKINKTRLRLAVNKKK